MPKAAARRAGSRPPGGRGAADGIIYYQMEGEFKEG